MLTVCEPRKFADRITVTADNAVASAYRSALGTEILFLELACQ
jgi:hypothetical protein